jgi:hypothetical protein
VAHSMSRLLVIIRLIEKFAKDKRSSLFSKVREKWFITLTPGRLEDGSLFMLKGFQCERGYKRLRKREQKCVCVCVSMTERNWESIYVCVCVCVCETERERREK